MASTFHYQDQNPFRIVFNILNFVLPVRFKQQKPLFVQESKTLKDSARRSKMT